MTTSVHIAETRAEVAEGRALIALVYRAFGVRFSDETYDLENKIERWPHELLLATVDARVVAVAGLYTRDTYVERFGGVSKAQIAQALVGNDVAISYSTEHTREVTKISVHPDYRGRGLGRLITGCAFAETFLQRGATAPSLVLVCAKHSVWRGVFGAAGISNRLISDFPTYKIHELYRSDVDPMDSRLIIPDIDIPDYWYGLTLPSKFHDEKIPRRVVRRRSHDARIG